MWISGSLYQGSSRVRIIEIDCYTVSYNRLSVFTQPTLRTNIMSPALACSNSLYLASQNKHLFLSSVWGSLVLESMGGTPVSIAI